jgi:hypothetical protein
MLNDYLKLTLKIFINLKIENHLNYNIICFFVYYVYIYKRNQNN